MSSNVFAGHLQCRLWTMIKTTPISPYGNGICTYIQSTASPPYVRVNGRRKEDKWRQRVLKMQEHEKLGVKKKSTQSDCNHYASTAIFIRPSLSSQKIKIGLGNQHPSENSFHFKAAFAFMNRPRFWPNTQILPCDWANIHTDFWFIQRDVPLNVSPWIRTRISKYWVPKMNSGKNLLSIQIMFLPFLSAARTKMSPKWLKADGFSSDTEVGEKRINLFCFSLWTGIYTRVSWEKIKLERMGETFHTVK